MCRTDQNLAMLLLSQENLQNQIKRQSMPYLSKARFSVSVAAFGS